MKVEESNNLIAEFMGWYEVGYSDVWNHENDDRILKDEDFKYNSSWDWLMPVLEKILDITFSEEGYNLEQFYSIRDGIPYINRTHKAVVEFIKFYNERK